MTKLKQSLFIPTARTSSHRHCPWWSDPTTWDAAATEAVSAVDAGGTTAGGCGSKRYFATSGTSLPDDADALCSSEGGEGAAVATFATAEEKFALWKLLRKIGAIEKSI